jgi:hypothetical protein
MSPAALALGLVGAAARGCGFHGGRLGRWIIPAAARSLPFGAKGAPGGRTHLILAVADHFEPDDGGAPPGRQAERVADWVREYPRALGAFRDADGRPPRHTFFYPVEAYRPEHLDALAGLCRDGFAEVEVHLHHDGDTAETLRATLRTAVERLARRHGLLARRRDTGAAAYGFVHGNWALDNARPDGRWCGVNDEARVLSETGCYADFTYPSAPSPTQPPTVNRIYYATSDPRRPRGHDRGPRVGCGPAPDGGLMMIPGPLLLNFRDRKLGVLPRLENGCVQASQPATPGRLDLWLRAGVCVPSRPDWSFVKLHAHGAPERDRGALLGEPMRAFHRALARRMAEDPGFSVHYVTAREMYNLARAAESGWDGTVDEARDFELVWGGG